MTVAFALLLLGALTAAMTPRLMARGSWADREPVLALWAWQCVVAAVLLCCVLAMALCAAEAWQAVRGHVFAPAPRQVLDAYALSDDAHPWAAALAVALFAGGVWTAAMLAREVIRARAGRRAKRAELRTRAPLMPGEEEVRGDRLTVLEGERPEAWWLPGPAPRLVITTAALRRLGGRQLDAVLAHEEGHVRARHDWLLHCSAALASAFPQVPVFRAFRHQMHHLVELAADDVASRRHGRLTTALALVGLNEDRGVFGPCASHHDAVPRRVDRLLGPADRLPVGRRLRATALASLVPVVPVVVAFVPGLRALG
ncbi:M56 family metallopeptidase [Streptomyces sp. TRM 70351]|uniref:M56 family metallopeptidase n=1 Tax=Streptomyces sp. TRM 70351 TaxID=3116552 RepID=UPI002E7AC585|nr:M56 family metallopeptidase [Streptomyces sp. TRM 70351]MEE1927245.1 M56 family metallopeptidase [Streptomyces sp. TRM 70351]